MTLHWILSTLSRHMASPELITTPQSGTDILVGFGKRVWVLVAALTFCIGVGLGLDGESAEIPADEESPEIRAEWAEVLSRAASDTNAPSAKRREAILSRPSARQLRYQEAQLGAFIHFGMPTFANGDMLSTPPASQFAPNTLAIAQWIHTARSFGARHLILTAKHHDGFCLWPTATTDYSVKSSPWRQGKADVLGDFVEACKRDLMSPGIYLSAGDLKFPCFASPDSIGKRVLRGNRDAYFPVFMQQLREVLTRYGELAVVWIDGAYDPFGWDVMDPSTGRVLGSEHAQAIQDLVRLLQPQATLFSGFAPDVRWSGSEQGSAPYPLWNFVARGEGLSKWVAPQSEGWFVVEANLPTRPDWFWTLGNDVRLLSVDRLWRAYLESIGRGANLLINITPDTAGNVPELESDRLAAFGTEIRRRVGHAVAQVESPFHWTPGHAIEVNLGGERQVDYVSIEEDLSRGQRVCGYELDLWRRGAWYPVATGSTIGRRRIEALGGVGATRLRLRITAAEAVPVLRRISVYRTLELGKIPSAID